MAKIAGLRKMTPKRLGTPVATGRSLTAIRARGTRRNAPRWLSPTCELAWGLDADRHTKLLINREAEGSLLEAYLQAPTP